MVRPVARCTIGRICVAVCLGLTLLRAGVAWAQQSRLIFIDPPRTIFEATSTALSTWRVQRIPHDGAGAASGSSEARARTLAAEHDATAVAWLHGEADGGVSLHVYHAGRRDHVARRLGVRPPFDDASAASVALSLKTILQNHDVPRARSTPVLAESRAPLLRTLSLGVGVTGAALSSGWVEPRLGLTLEWAPLRMPYALAGQLAVGPIHARTHGDARATFSELILGLELRRGFAWPLGVDAVAHLGPSFHRARFSVSREKADALPFVRIRWNPGASLGLRLRRHVGWNASVEVFTTAGYRAYSQHYRDFAGTILHTPHVSLDVGINLHIALIR